MAKSKPPQEEPSSSTTTASSITAADFFRDQEDLVSEILGFLDVRSLLTLCNTTKKAVSLLRYDHVFLSARTNQVSAVSDDPRVRIAYRNSSIILHKLATVYDLQGQQNGKPAGMSSPAAHWTKLRKRPPSPLRLLRLANGRRCERCHCDVFSPCLWAGSQGLAGSKIVLPSLSFGEFSCIQCIFDERRWLPKRKEHSHDHDRDHYQVQC